mgnify:CR=1 FL=1
MENILLYSCIAFILYILLSMKKPDGEMTRLVHRNHARYKLDNYFGSDR